MVPSRSDKPRPPVAGLSADDLEPLEPDQPWDSQSEGEPTGPTAVAQETAAALEPVTGPTALSAQETASLLEPVPEERRVAAQTLDQLEEVDDAEDPGAWDEDGEAPEGAAKDTLDLDDEGEPTAKSPAVSGKRPPRRRRSSKPVPKAKAPAPAMAGFDGVEHTFSGKSPDQLHGRKAARIAPMRGDGFESAQSAGTLPPAGAVKARPSMKLGPLVVESSPLNVVGAILTVVLLAFVGWMLWGLLA